jgi:hypothetical protein
MVTLCSIEKQTSRLDLGWSSMQANSAIRAALAEQRVREPHTEVELRVSWNQDPSWRMLRYVTAIRSLLRDAFGCEVQLVAAGPGCFFATYTLELAPEKFERELMAGGRDKLKTIRERFEVDKMNIKTPNSNISIFS